MNGARHSEGACTHAWEGDAGYVQQEGRKGGTKTFVGEYCIGEIGSHGRQRRSNGGHRRG